MTKEGKSRDGRREERDERGSVISEEGRTNAKSMEYGVEKE